MSSAIKKQLEDARYLIQTKRYDEARIILEKIHHPIASKWLENLDAKFARKPKKKKKSTPSWLEGLEDLSQIPKSDTLTDGPNKLLEQMDEAKKKDKTHSKLWDKRAKAEKEVAIVPRALIGGFIGAVIGTILWTGAILGFMLWAGGAFGIDAASFTTVTTFGGAIVGGFTGVMARMFTSRGSFYGGIFAAFLAISGYLVSKLISIVVLLNINLDTSADMDMSSLTNVLEHPLIFSPVADGMALALGAVLAWAIASSLGGVLE